MRPLGDDSLRSPGVAYLVESTRLLAGEFGPDRPVCAVVTAPVDLPAMLLGIETWLGSCFSTMSAPHASWIWPRTISCA